MSLKHDGLYARAWGCEDKKSIFDAGNDDVLPPDSPEVAVKSDSSTDETWITLRPARDCSRELFPQTEVLCDVTDTYPYVELDAETSSEQPNNSAANPAVLTKMYVLSRPQVAMKITDINSCVALVCFTERMRRRSRNSRTKT